MVRKLLGYKRFEGLAASRAITRLYAASRLFVNFFQPSFKLASKQRDGAKVFKRYHPPMTPCERLLQADSIPVTAKQTLRQVSADLDPLKLLEEMRAVQAYLAVLADGEAPPPMTTDPPNLASFVASLSSAWHAGEVRPTFSIQATPRYLRGLQKLPTRPPNAVTPSIALLTTPLVAAPTAIKLQEKPKVVYAHRRASSKVLDMVWPLACRRLESLPNINARQLFDELCVQFPGRFGPKQYRKLLRRVNLWRQDARARGIEIRNKTYRRFSGKPRGTRPCKFKDQWSEMAQCLEANPDQTALELLVEFQARYPGRYGLHQLRTLQKRVQAWRQKAIERLICEVSHRSHDLSAANPCLA